MKKNRQEKILELITQFSIGTQDELITRLQESGYTATQATVSRDIRSLKLLKVLLADGSYRYMLPKEEKTESENDLSYQKTYAESIKEVNYSLNNIVIKTTPGMASAVALTLDRANHEMMLGCVAGDDTIIVVAKTVDDARILSEKIWEQKMI